MGTNYYGQKIPTKKELEEIANVVLTGDLENAKVLIEDFEEVHIGKSSGGWRFLFDHNGQEWKSFQDYKDFVNSHKLYNEYGTEISSDEFWSLVDEKQAAFPSFIEKTNMPSWYVVLDGYEFASSTNFS